MSDLRSFLRTMISCYETDQKTKPNLLELGKKEFRELKQPKEFRGVRVKQTDKESQITLLREIE